MVVQRAFIINW